MRSCCCPLAGALVAIAIVRGQEPPTELRIVGAQGVLSFENGTLHKVASVSVDEMGKLQLGSTSGVDVDGQVRIDAAGNVGIGMGSTAPAALLDVRPGSYASTLTTYATLGRFQFQSCTGCGADRIDHHKNSYVSKNTYGLVISSSATLGGSYTSTGDASIKFYYPSAGGGNQAGSQLEFWTNTNGYAGTTEARRMTIGSSGNVHIAATNTDTAELTVDGDVDVKGGSLSIRSRSSGLAWDRAQLNFDIRNSNGDAMTAYIQSNKVADISSTMQFFTTASHAVRQQWFERSRPSPDAPGAPDAPEPRCA